MNTGASKRICAMAVLPGAQLFAGLEKKHAHRSWRWRGVRARAAPCLIDLVFVDKRGERDSMTSAIALCFAEFTKRDKHRRAKHRECSSLALRPHPADSTPSACRDRSLQLHDCDFESCGSARESRPVETTTACPRLSVPPTSVPVTIVSDAAQK